MPSSANYQNLSLYVINYIYNYGIVTDLNSLSLISQNQTSTGSIISLMIKYQVYFVYSLADRRLYKYNLSN